MLTQTTEQNHLTEPTHLTKTNSTPIIKLIRNPNAEGVRQHLLSRFKEYGNQERGFTRFLEHHLYFITLSPRAIKSPNIPSARAAFEEFYMRVVKRMFGAKNIGRKFPFCPLLYAFTDVEGTRAQRTFDIRTSTMPHVHGLLLARPEHIALLEEALDHEKGMMRDPKALLVRRYDSNEASIERLISYCMKGYDRMPRTQSGREDMWIVLPPESKKKRAPYGTKKVNNRQSADVADLSERC